MRVLLAGVSILSVCALAGSAAPARGQQSSTSEANFKVSIFGAAKLDVMYNTARPQGPGLPAFLVPRFAGGFSQHTIAMNARNSMVGLLFTVPDIGKFHSGGRISAVFFDNTNVFADNNGFLLTQAYGELFNDDWRFRAGLQLDVLAPLVPTVLPFSVDGAPVGNTIKGQIRVERFLKLGSESQLTLQAALSEPINSIKTPDISLDEDNGWPNVEATHCFWFGKAGAHRHRPADAASRGGRCLRRGRPASEDLPSKRTCATGCF